MSREIDERVVEMRFDNKQFEKGAKETMTTLERLKSALNMSDSAKALDGLKKATQGISVDGLTAGITALQERFSTLGIIGMRVIQNLTDAVMGKLGSAFNFVSDAIVGGGKRRAMNIENAHFQLQALLKDESKVQAVMDNAMESVDGTAYAYDEAAKAAAMFAASGIEAGDDMLNALKGITGVAAMTNSDFQSMSMIFTTVAGNGRLMGDQLLQLSSRGLNAASTIADYFREVRGEANITETDIREMVTKGMISFKDFSDAMTWAFGDSAKRANETFTGSLSNMKSALARIGAEFFSPIIEQNSDMVKLFNALRIKINDVKSALTFSQEKSAISGLAEASRMSTEEVTALFDTIKERGTVAMEDFDKLQGKGVYGISALTKYLNGVSDGSIRASYAVTTAVNQLTEGTQVSAMEVRKFIDEGKISMAMFTGAMETEYGNLRALSKQVTDFILDNVKKLTEAVNNADLTKPLEGFYYVVEIIKNGLKGLWSVIAPIGGAFRDVFLIPENGEGILNFLAEIQTATENFKLSEKSANNLRDAFTGVFNVVKLLVQGLVSLLRLFFPMIEPVSDLGEGFLSLTGYMGRALTQFTEWARKAPSIRRAYDNIGKGISWVSKQMVGFVGDAKQAVKAFLDLPIVENTIGGIRTAIEVLMNNTGPFIDSLPDKFHTLKKTLTNLIPENLRDGFNFLADAFKKTFGAIDLSEIQNLMGLFEKLSDAANKFGKTLMSNEGVYAFVTNIKIFFQDLQDAFTIDNLLDKMDRARDVLQGWIDWVKDNLGPMFENFSIGGTVAAGGGIGIIYALIKAFTALDKSIGLVSAVTSPFKALTGTLKAMQENLKADALIKIAGAIGILAVSLTIMSFADMDRLAFAAAGLMGVVYLIGEAVKKITMLRNSGTSAEKIMQTLATGLKRAGNNLAKALKWRYISQTIVSFTVSVGILVAAIAGIGYLYVKDSRMVWAGLGFVVGIIAMVTGIMVSMQILSKKMTRGSSAFGRAAKGIMEVAIAVGIIVWAINAIMQIKIPEGGMKKQLTILAAALITVGTLIGLLAVATNFIDKEGGKFKTAPLINVALAMIVMVEAINRLFKIDMSTDYDKKMWTLIGIMSGMMMLLVILGAITQKSDGALKATGTLLALSAFLGVAVLALMTLTLVKDWGALGAAAAALGGVLIALGVALYGAGQISEKSNWKSILAMGINLAAMVAMLGILTIVPIDGLITSGLALGFLLLVLGKAFEGAGKMTGDNHWKSVLSMVAALGVICIGLGVLSNQPWEGLITAAASMSICMLALAESMAIAGKAKFNKEMIIGFVAGAAAMAAVGLAMTPLAQNDWGNILAAAVGLSAVALALSGALFIVGKSKIDPVGIVAFVSAAVGISALGLVVGLMAQQDWQSLLVAAVGLGVVAVALGAALVLIANIPVNPLSIAAFVAEVVMLAVIGGVIWGLSSLPFESVVQGLIVLAGGLIIIGGAGVIFGMMAAPMIAGAVALIAMSAAVAIAGVAILAFVVAVTTAIDILGQFISGLSNFNFSEVGHNIVQGLIDGILGGIKGLIDAGIALGKSFIGTVCDFFGIASPAKEMKPIGEYVDAGFAEGIESGKGEIDEAANSVFGGFMDMFDFSGIKDAGAGLIGSFGSGFSGGIPDIQSMVGSVFSGTNVQTDTTTYHKAGEQAADSYGTGFTSGSMDIEAMMTEVFSGSGLDLDYSEYFNIGDMANMNFADGLTGGGTGDMSAVVSDMVSVDSGSVDLSGYYDVGSEGGTQFLSGFQSGASNEAIQTMVSNVLNQLATQIHLFSVNAGLASAGFNMMVQVVSGFGQGTREQAMVAVALFTKNMLDAFQNNHPALKTRGSEAGNAYLTGFREKGEEVKETAFGFVAKALEGIRKKAPEFLLDGFDAANRYIKGIQNQFNSVFSNGVNFAGRAVQGILTKASAFLSSGSSLAGNFVSGIGSQNGASSNAGRALGQAALNILNELRPAFQSAGSNAGAGFADGIRSQISAVQAAAKALAEAASSVPKNVLKIKSPSRVLMAIGEYVSLGFAKGILNKTGEVEDASTVASRSAIGAMQQAISAISDIVTDEDFEFHPTISPVVDLSNVNASADDISRMFNEAVNTNAVQIEGVAARFQTPQQTQQEGLATELNGMKALVQKIPTENGTTIQNTFYITSDNTEEVAQAVADVIQKQVERKEAVWGS